MQKRILVVIRYREEQGKFVDRTGILAHSHRGRLFLSPSACCILHSLIEPAQNPLAENLKFGVGFKESLLKKFFF